MVVCLKKQPRSGGKDLKSSGAYPMAFGAKIASLHREWMDGPLETNQIFLSKVDPIIINNTRSL